MPRRALITGVSGQDGSYLAELLHGEGIEIVGIALHAPPAYVAAVANVRTLDLTDRDALDALVREVQPDECYHLAAYHRSSQTRTDLDAADEDRAHLMTNLVAAQALLSSLHRHAPRCRTFLAGSCHMFGDPTAEPQTEATPFAPTSMYGVTKVATAQLGRVLRGRDGLFCATGILYNHESPRRGPEFITTRIARGAAEVAAGRRSDPIVVGNLQAKVDWGFAGDYVDAMRRMVRAEKPDDYVVATGTLHSVAELAEEAFSRVGLEWTRHVVEDPKAHKPVSRSVYRGDATKIGRELGWAPRTSFRELVGQMVDHHVRIAA